MKATPITEQLAYVLHCHAYRETSMLCEIFSRKYGRLGVIAKGVRQPKKNQAALLIPFQQVLMSWVPRGDLAVLADVEQCHDSSQLSGQGLYCGFYMNELLLRLLHRHDPHERLFDCYQQSLRHLQNHNLNAVLRIFEKRLLSEIGYGLVLDHDIVNTRPIQDGEQYIYITNAGPAPYTGNQQQGIVIKGECLNALASESLDNTSLLLETKPLMRALLAPHLGDKPLQSRKLFRRKAMPLEGN